MTKEEIRKAARVYAFTKSKEKNTYFVDYKDIEEAFMEGALFAFIYTKTNNNEMSTNNDNDN